MYYLRHRLREYTWPFIGDCILMTERTLRLNASKFRFAVAVCAVLSWCAGCRNSPASTIAVIPRTSGTPFWEPAHVGAELAARITGTKIYWNATTREDDVQGQIALVETVIDRRYQGLVLAPDHALALITPVRRALLKGTPTVIIGSPLPIPAGGRLSYILNDEEEAGQMAALRVGQLLAGKGSVAILGVNPDITGIMVRARSLEASLTQRYPGIRIVEERLGSFNVPHEQQIAEETLRGNPDLNAIVALTSASTRGICSALAHRPHMQSTKVIGFDEAEPAFILRELELDSVIIQNNREIGMSAVKTIVAKLQGQPVPPEVKLKPLLLTRSNFYSPEVRHALSVEWWQP
jgi:ribose transport system substrate-binding protein